MKDAFTPKKDAVTDLAHRHKMSFVAGNVNISANRGVKVLNIRPISLKDANDYIIENHRHHDKVQGHKFSEACYDGDRLCGVAVVGRPVARHLDDGKTLEVTRLCTDGTKNACSILYARCAKIAKDMGYTKIITYILESEHGSSLLASGWTCEDDSCGGGVLGSRFKTKRSVHRYAGINVRRSKTKIPDQHEKEALCEGVEVKPITSEENRQERIAQVKRQLGSPKISPMKRRDLQKYLRKLQYAEVTE